MTLRAFRHNHVDLAIDVKLGPDELVLVVNHVGVAHRAARRLRMRRSRRQSVATAARGVGVARLGPNGNCGACRWGPVAVAVVATPGDRVVSRAVIVGRRQRSEAELRRRRVVCMPHATDRVGNHVTLLASHSRVSLAGVEMDGVRADPGIRRVGRPQQVAWRCGAQQRAAVSRRIAMA